MFLAEKFFTAVKAGFPSERICFHGNNKTNDELTMALDNNVGRIVVDNVEELKKAEHVGFENR